MIDLGTGYPLKRSRLSYFVKNLTVTLKKRLNFLGAILQRDPAVDLDVELRQVCRADLGGRAVTRFAIWVNPLSKCRVRAVAAVSDGCAVFLGNEDKAFVMFVDQSVGAAITMFMQGTQKGGP
jgi:hypothetical protein